MDRRNFFKIVGTASGGLLTGACGKQAHEILPILVPEREIVPGVEQWRPSVCRECGAGCGILVRIMEAEHQVQSKGEKVLERIAAIKKIEGNPLDPVSGGRLCARGQAAVQTLYHPDRLQGPHKRSGPRGDEAFERITWEQALTEAAATLEKADPSRVVFLTRPQPGSRAATVGSFLEAIGAPPASTVGFCDYAIERRAAELAFGWDGLPIYEIQDADFVLGLGADFLGGWISPVLFARRFGHMRQGRPGRRGRLVQVESRFSLTAGNADRWLPLRPGGELAFALAIGHLLVNEKLARTANTRLLDSFASVDLNQAVKTCGLHVQQIRDLARELGQSEAPVVVAGASIVQTNSLDAVVAGNALNWLLGSVGRSGGVAPPAAAPLTTYAASRPRHRDFSQSLKAAEVVILDGVNPVYALPETAELLAKAPAIISFSRFIDDSSAYADLLLPDHASLESGEVVVPDMTSVTALNGAPPYVRPLHETRATEEVLAELGKRLGRQVEPETARNSFRKLFAEKKLGQDWAGADEFAEYCERQGGWWAESGTKVPAKQPTTLPSSREPQFHGAAAEFPLHFQPYPSVQFGDGSGAHLPWMQALPDPASSAMWGLPIEVDPRTAVKLSLRNGEIVRVVSPRGELEAPVYVNPAAIPGVVSMAIGQGHTHYGRYASGRGANPLAIVVSEHDSATGALAFGATRVRLEKTGRTGSLVQFSMVDRRPEVHRR